MAKSGIVTVLDIGSSKVVCLIAYVDSVGNIKVAGIGHQISQGIRAGIVIDVKKAESSILAAINAAEKMADVTIEHAYINISGTSVNSHLINVETKISGHEVTDLDVKHIIQQGYENFAQEEIEIVHCLPVDYAIDDACGIKDPRGMYGEKLSTDLHVITASTTVVRNLANCLARCHLNVDDYAVSPYVSGLACLTEDEKNLGCILLDIGSGNTAIAMFAEGHCIHTDSVAIGGGHVTRDIARGLSTTLTYAERIKNLYGTVIPTAADQREIIDIPISDLQEDIEPELDLRSNPGTGESYISRALLTSIIKPRMEEILEMAKKKLEARGLYQHTGPRVVITGGGSQIQGLKELGGHIFNKHVRIAKPETINGMADAMQGPAFSTAVGMLKYAASNYASRLGSLQETEKLAKKKGSGTVMKWLKENF